jgi:hypothetical protein
VLLFPGHVLHQLALLFVQLVAQLDDQVVNFVDHDGPVVLGVKLSPKIFERLYVLLGEVGQFLRHPRQLLPDDEPGLQMGMAPAQVLLCLDLVLHDNQ